MVEEFGQTVWNALVGRRGETLRVVTVYDDEEYATELRDDLRDVYTTEELSRVFEEMLLNGINRPYQEEIVDVGDLEYTARAFEDAYIGYYSPETRQGIAFSLERESGVDLGDLEDELRFLREEYPPETAGEWFA
jgi:hypothetical protein